MRKINWRKKLEKYQENENFVLQVEKLELEVCSLHNQKDELEELQRRKNEKITKSNKEEQILTSKTMDGQRLLEEKEVDEPLKKTFQKPIVPTDLYRGVRDSHLIGMSGYSKEGLPGIAFGVGLSTFDKASIHYYVQSHIQMNEYRDRVIMPCATKKFGRHISTCIKVLEMTGLKLSARNRIKVVRPLLQERTRRKVQVLSENGRDELLKIMDYASLPHFCKREGSGSTRYSRNGTIYDCFSLDHSFHQQLYNYTKEQAKLLESAAPIKQGSFHVDFPEPNPENAKTAQTIESEFQRLGNRKGLSNSLRDIKLNAD